MHRTADGSLFQTVFLLKKEYKGGSDSVPSPPIMATDAVSLSNSIVNRAEMRAEYIRKSQMQNTILIRFAAIIIFISIVRKSLMHTVQARGDLSRVRLEMIVIFPSDSFNYFHYSIDDCISFFCRNCLPSVNNAIPNSRPFLDFGYFIFCY